MEWQTFRLAGQDALAVRASKKLRNDELLVTGFAPTRLRMELDRVPLWRGDHVAIKQLVEDFARYLYLPRLQEPAVLHQAIRDGIGLLTWVQDSFAYGESYDEATGRYRGLRCGRLVNISDQNLSGLLVKPEVALKQQEAETQPVPGVTPAPSRTTGTGVPTHGGEAPGTAGSKTAAPAAAPKRFTGASRSTPRVWVATPAESATR